MRIAFVVGAGLLLAGLVAACGGSASETPWPVDPQIKPLGPASEQGPGAAVDDKGDAPDGGRRPKSGE